MKADEMFERLGYDKTNEVPDSSHNYNLQYSNGIDLICFDYKNKAVTKFYFGYEDISPEDITLKELQAINEKVKELGWNEIN